MKIDFANQIANLINKYLPYTSEDIGSKYQAQSFAISSNTLTMTLTAGDYTFIAGKINDALNPNASFTVNNIHLKNKITEFTAYPKDDIYQNYFAFEAVFDFPHKLKKDQEITLKDFTNPIYNITYRVLKTDTPRSAVLVPITTLTFVDVTTGLGFNPTEYTIGLNGLQTLVDAGANNISFDFGAGLLYTTSDINDVDTDFQPYITDYQDNIKVMSKETFRRNLTNQPNTNYLLIDTTTLVGTPLRSTSNQSDANYSAYSRTGFFDRNYTISLYYILERKDDDADNQTFSGADIAAKQLSMGDSLTSILRQPLTSDNTRIMSSVTVENEGVSDAISEGMVTYEYQLQFVSSFLPEILLNLDEEEIYPIDSVKINTDEINFT